MGWYRVDGGRITSSGQTREWIWLMAWGLYRLDGGGIVYGG